MKDKIVRKYQKPWWKATLKEINNLINYQTFLIEDPKDGEPVTPCMDVYKSMIQSDGSMDKLKLRIVVRGDLQNKEMAGDTQSPTASMRTLKYFIGAFLKAKLKNRVFVKLDMRYADYFPEYAQYFGRALKLLKSVYGMTNSGKLFADEMTDWLK